MDPVAALRSTFGVVVPLVVGIAAGSVADGLAASIGALSGGFAAFQGTYRSRATVMVSVAGGMALSTLVGALADTSTAATVVVDAVWGFAAGMLVVLGPAALVVGLQWGVAVLVVTAIPMTTGQALVRAAMVLAGGVLQTVLVAGLWPLQNYPAERKAVAAAYRAAARYCRYVAGGGTLSVADPSYDEARAVLRDPLPLGRAERVEAFGGLLDELGRLRLHLAALGRLQSIVVLPEDAHGALCAFYESAADLLEAVAAAVSEHGAVASATPHAMADGVVERLVTVEPRWAAADIATNVQMLSGQLRSAVRITDGSVATGEPIHGERHHRRRTTPRRAWLSASGQTLVANLSWDSAAFRHAVRLAVALAGAAMIDRFGGFARGYWIGLTALVILRPDFATTMVRGVSRLAGTLAGAVVSTVLVAWLRPGTALLAVLFTLSVVLAYTVVRANYLLFSVCVTAYVVFLLSFARLPALTTVDDRVIDTLLGGGLAFVVYLAWPTWESRVVGEQLARLLDSQRRYVAAVLAVFADPAGAPRARLDTLRDAARRERSNTEASLQRLQAEPARAGALDGELVTGIAAAARRIALGVLTLHANLPDATARPLPQLGGLARSLDEILVADAQSLRSDRPTSGAADSARRLRAEHEQLRAALSREEPQAAIVVSETDLLVDGVNTTTELLHRRTTTARGAATS